MSHPHHNLSRLAIHTITNRPLDPHQCIHQYAHVQAGGITFWRRDFDHASPTELGTSAREAGLDVVSLARGGFFAAADPRARQLAVEDNLRAIDEAHACGAPSLVLVCGAVPRQPMDKSRAQIRDGIAACLAHAAQAGVVLAIEPLHPMYADERSAINTMAQANALCETLGDHPNLGIALDVYHTWWDPDLEAAIARAGARGNLTSFHICDWLCPTRDLLNDRGIMGDGIAPIAQISSWADRAGFTGPREVEIFSDTQWSRDQAEVIGDIVRAYTKLYPTP